MRSFLLLASAALAIAPTLVAASSASKDASLSRNDCPQSAAPTKVWERCPCGKPDGPRDQHWGQRKHKKSHAKSASRHHKQSHAVSKPGGSKGWSWSTSWATTITYGAPAGQTAAPAKHLSSSEKASSSKKASTSSKKSPTKKSSTIRPVSTRKPTASKTRKPTTVTSTRTRTSSTAPAATKTSSAAAGSVEKVSLDLHNQYRAQHGVGALTWSTKLASAAQAWADKCVFEHGGGKALGAGENLAAWSGSSSDVSQGVQMWYSASHAPSCFPLCRLVRRIDR